MIFFIGAIIGTQGEIYVSRMLDFVMPIIQIISNVQNIFVSFGLKTLFLAAF